MAFSAFLACWQKQTCCWINFMRKETEFCWFIRWSPQRWTPDSVTSLLNYNVYSCFYPRFKSVTSRDQAFQHCERLLSGSLSVWQNGILSLSVCLAFFFSLSLSLTFCQFLCVTACPFLSLNVFLFLAASSFSRQFGPAGSLTSKVTLPLAREVWLAGLLTIFAPAAVLHENSATNSKIRPQRTSSASRCDPDAVVQVPFPPPSILCCLHRDSATYR